MGAYTHVTIMAQKIDIPVKINQSPKEKVSLLGFLPMQSPTIKPTTTKSIIYCHLKMICHDEYKKPMTNQKQSISHFSQNTNDLSILVKFISGSTGDFHNDTR